MKCEFLLKVTVNGSNELDCIGNLSGAFKFNSDILDVHITKIDRIDELNKLSEVTNELTQTN